ncbi:MAG: pyridoxamine 5'-phosphate oxidase family protein [Syntrophorhabdales bacterium]|jgi:uncharacterized pyridoxamine 5'-phosphate oxidase family protein
MSTALEFLKENKVFHLGTTDGTKGRVRPFAFVMKRNNTIYFCTGKGKDVYKQMSQYPDIEICAMGSNDTWLRIRGKIAFDDSRDAKAQAFAEAPNLMNIYKKGADDETFVTFHFTDGVATLYSFAGAPKNLPLV